MGGNAVLNIRSVNKEEVLFLLYNISRITDIPYYELKLLGSAGKQIISNDLDIAIDINKFNKEKVHERMLSFTDGVFNTGSNIGSYRYPIQDEYVQIDLMFVENTEWAQFSYFSPGEKSKYKGAIRAILLSAAASAIYNKENYFFYDIDGSLLLRVSFGIDPNRGLKRMFKMRTPKKRGKGYTKTLRSATPKEIKRYFPQAEFSEEEILIDNPKTVVEMIFGKGVKVKDVETVEQITNLIDVLWQKHKSETIYQRAAERCKPLIGKMEIPPEIKRYIE